ASYRGRRHPGRQEDQDQPALHLRRRPDERAGHPQGGGHRPGAAGEGAERRRAGQAHHDHGPDGSGRGRAPPADPAEHRPAAGHQQLPRQPAPPVAAAPRPADPVERPHPQGPAEDGRRQEGREGTRQV
ncbi:MAG: SSU ribosomal protein S13p (S18e), partial [uncultured Phycisphaerae bacterium]